MELRPVNPTFHAARQTARLPLSPSHRDDALPIETYLVECAVHRDAASRDRCPASRRLLAQTPDPLADFDALANGDRRRIKDPSSVGHVAAIRASNANWPPSRKREEAAALENLRNRVRQSRSYEASRVSGSASVSSALDNADRPNLFRKILSDRPMSIARDTNDLETDWRDSEFITECLCWHNVYRQRHDAPPLTMSPQLCEYAQTWANHLAHTNTFYYRNDRRVGQNLYCRPGGGDLTADVTGQDVASYWYSAVRQYDFFKEPDILHANVNAGHFTQLVWASSRCFGVGKARSRSGKIVVVANYRPVGNVSGQFQDNVSPPLPENLNVPALSASRQRQPPTTDDSVDQVFRERCVASDSPPLASSSALLSLSRLPSTVDGDRSSVSSAR